MIQYEEGPNPSFSINKFNLILFMTTQFINKFNNHLPSIREAIEGKDDLRQNRKLYKKIYKYFKDRGISFTGDDVYDYETVLECIYEVI